MTYKINGKERIRFNYQYISFVSIRSIRIKIEGKEMWLPKKCITIDSEKKFINMPIWLAVKRQLKNWAPNMNKVSSIIK